MRPEGGFSPPLPYLACVEAENPKDEAWVEARLVDPPLAATRRNARRTALVMYGLGDDRPGVERALGSAAFHPAIACDAAAWAWEQLQEADAPLRRAAASGE